MIDIPIYGVIGADVTARQVREQLAAAGRQQNIRVLINSAGGSVFDGLAIYGLLSAYPGRVTVQVDGIAASMASAIAMVGSEITIAQNAFLMIHDPAGSVEGKADELRTLADLLDKTREQITSIYARRTKQTAEQVTTWMSAETWFTAQEAVAAGFADRIIPANKLAAQLDLSKCGFQHLPQALKGQLNMPNAQATIADLKAACPGAPADFLIAQLESGADLPTAKAAWLDQREKQLAERESKARAPGVAPIADHRKARGEQATDDADSFAARVTALIKGGMSRPQAVAIVGRADPAGHRAYVESNNSTSARVQGLIADRFTL